MPINMFIHEYVPATDPNAPTLLLLHGTGGDESSLLSLGQQLAPGAGLLSPRGNVLEGSYPRFFRRKAEGVFDMEDLIARTHELADWIAVASAEYHFDPASLIALGYSNGANIAASVLLLRPEALKRAVLLRVMVPLVPEQAPDLSAAHILMESGTVDSLIPLPQSEKLAQMFREYGADVKFDKQPADHRLTNADLVAVQQWLQQQQAAINSINS
ncbi:MAG: alpha/beta hydrolase fold domain-containing protein [Chloroflexi bacterium]|nr:alpha/beta hydrolase fold domain-containing protein [Chloroflexota bacterium]